MKILPIYFLKTVSYLFVILFLSSVTSFTLHRPTETVAKASPLSKYITDYKYTPFAVFRSDWGVGTVITFKKKAEEIIALKKECLTVDEDSTDVTLSSLAYTLSKDDNIELNLSKVISDKLNLKAAFTDARIKKVTINLLHPKEKVASQVTIKRKISELAKAENQECLDAIFGSKNTVIVRVLLVESLSYSFYDKDNRQITIDAQFLDKIGADATLKKQYEGTTEIKIEKPTFIGYRLSKYTASNGFAVSDIKSTNLTPEQVRALKAGGK